MRKCVNELAPLAADFVLKAVKAPRSAPLAAELCFIGVDMTKREGFAAFYFFFAYSLVEKTQRLNLWTIPSTASQCRQMVNTVLLNQPEMNIEKLPE